MAIAAGLTACGQSGGDTGAANNAANATANAAAPKRPTYCFFKDAATRGWAAAPDASGNVAIKGQVKVDDKRYRGELSQSEVAGDTARVWLTMAPNTGYADEDNWWDVTITVPDSGAAAGVTVLCGKKEVAQLKVRRG
jgi:uncharacterized protein YfiM (DUF2279 family)